MTQEMGKLVFSSSQLPEQVKATRTLLAPWHKASAIPARPEHQQRYDQRYYRLSYVPITTIVEQVLQVHTT